MRMDRDRQEVLTRLDAIRTFSPSGAPSGWLSAGKCDLAAETQKVSTSPSTTAHKVSVRATLVYLTG